MCMLDSDLRGLNEGDIIILPPRMSYSFCAAELGDEYNVSVDAVVFRFDEQWLDTLLGVFKTLNNTVLKIREIDVPYTVVGPKWMKMSNLLSDLSSPVSGTEPALLLSLLDMLSSRKDMVRILQPAQCDILPLSEKLEKIGRYINSNVYGKVSLEEVSSYLGMNRTYFCMFFKKHFGKGFAEYLNDMRVDKATVMLANRDKTISDIARECGFKTAPYFTRAFRRSRGITPAEYRKKVADR